MGAAAGPALNCSSSLSLCGKVECAAVPAWGTPWITKKYLDVQKHT